VRWVDYTFILNYGKILHVKQNFQCFYLTLKKEEVQMPTIKVEGTGSFQVEEGNKLVLALEDNGVDILHRCGGKAKCTTCRIEILEGDAGSIDEAEAAILDAKGYREENIRLSCQVRVHSDLTVKPVMTASETGMEPGTRPDE
jgi:ferredoxin